MKPRRAAGVSPAQTTGKDRNLPLGTSAAGKTPVARENGIALVPWGRVGFEANGRPEKMSLAKRLRFLRLATREKDLTNSR